MFLLIKPNQINPPYELLLELIGQIIACILYRPLSQSVYLPPRKQEHLQKNFSFWKKYGLVAIRRFQGSN